MNVDFVTWLIFGVIVYLAVRWLTTSQSLSVNRHALRLSVLQWLQHLRPDIEVQDATDDLLRFAVGRHICTFHLEQLARRCIEQPAKMPLLVQDAVSAFAQACDDLDGLPTDWERRVVLQLLPEGATGAEALLHRPLLPGIDIGYALENGASFRWIRADDLLETGVNLETLHDKALRNLERSCNALVIDTREGDADGEELMLRFQTGDGLDAARLLVPNFFQRFGPRFGNTTLLVGIPGRDALFIVSAENPGTSGWLAWRLRLEHRRQAYPLLSAPLRVSEQGIEPA